jgi:TRAP-type C4-dicarboxylate transport system permease small subunit
MIGNRLSWAYKRLLGLFEWFLFICFAILVTVVFANVVSRYVLHYSLAWAEELSRFLFVWIAFIGSVIANDKFGHMRLDLLVTELPKPASTVLEIIVSVVATLTMLIMLVGGYSMMVASLDYRSAALEVPYGIVNSVVPVCCAIMCGQTIVRTVSLALDLRESSGGSSE